MEAIIEDSKEKIMQAIVTRYIGPTNFKGTRIRARLGDITLMAAYHYDLDSMENHREAAKALLRANDWLADTYSGDLHGGLLPNGDWVWVMVVTAKPKPWYRPNILNGGVHTHGCGQTGTTVCGIASCKLDCACWCHIPSAPSPYVSAGCRREESECSINPCADVIADREATI